MVSILLWIFNLTSISININSVKAHCTITKNSKLCLYLKWSSKTTVTLITPQSTTISSTNNKNVKKKASSSSTSPQNKKKNNPNKTRSSWKTKKWTVRKPQNRWTFTKNKTMMRKMIRSLISSLWCQWKLKNVSDYDVWPIKSVWILEHIKDWVNITDYFFLISISFFGFNETFKLLNFLSMLLAFHTKLLPP